MIASEGHRERLRARFINEPKTLTEVELLELFLTYTIPRKNIAPLAQSLLNRFGSISAVLLASKDELLSVEGVGEATITFIQVISMVLHNESDMKESPANQIKLFDLDYKAEATELKPSVKKERIMRVFANDEIANSLTFIPKAAGFKTVGEFKQFLYNGLPYNSAVTARKLHC
jgi:DNA repair protein RadC